MRNAEACVSVCPGQSEAKAGVCAEMSKLLQRTRLDRYGSNGLNATENVGNRLHQP